MNPIILAVAVLAVLGLVGSIILVLASKFMAVYEDPRIAEVTACLAGANCGGCGYAGCADYAKAIVEDGAPTFKCAPGGDKTADAINEIMGGRKLRPAEPAGRCALQRRRKLPAALHLPGRTDLRGAASVAGGPSACAYGCLGLGDCTRACVFDAMHIVNGRGQS